MLSLTASLFILLLPLASCRPQFLARIPNGGASVIPNSGLTCLALGHEECVPGAARNSFGLDFKAAEYRWTLALCRKDSDGDGLTNGEELGDPCCEWTEVNRIPLRTKFLSHPGDKNENGAKNGPKCDRDTSGGGSETTPPTTTLPSTRAPRTTTTTPPTTTRPATARPPPTTQSRPTTRAPRTTRRRPTTRAPRTTRNRTTTRAPRTTRNRTTTRAPRTTRNRPTTRAPRTTRDRTTTRAPRTTRRRPTTRAPRTTRDRTTTRAPRTSRNRTTTRAPRTRRPRGMSSTSSDTSATTSPSESLMAPSPDEMSGPMPLPTESFAPKPSALANPSESPFPMFSPEPAEEDRIPDPLGSCTLRKDRLTVACVCFAALNKDLKLLASRREVVKGCVDLFDSKDNIRELGFACDKFKENEELEEDRVRRRITVLDMCLES